MTNTVDPEHDNQIARLLKLAGRRPSPSADRLQRAREAAQAEWRHTLQVRARRRLLRAIAAAAIIAGLGGAAWIRQHRVPAPVNRPEIATLQKVIGTVRLSDQMHDGPAAIVTANGRLRVADRLETGEDSGAALRCVDGPSIRLAAGTAAAFESAGRLRLIAGTIYVDSDPEHAANALVVVTAFGTVRHVGTQFELRLQQASLDIRVREGEVSIESAGGRVTAAAGEALLVTGDRPAERRRIASSGPEWAWIGAMAGSFTLEGAALPAFLHWVSREEGLRWEYADAAAKRVADRAVLHGSIEGLTPAEALRAVLPAAGLSSRRAGDRLIVRAATE